MIAEHFDLTQKVELNVVQALIRRLNKWPCYDFCNNWIYKLETLSCFYRRASAFIGG